jgi:hypothetical protein
MGDQNTSIYPIIEGYVWKMRGLTLRPPPQFLLGGPSTVF